MYSFDLYIHTNKKNKIPALVSFYSFKKYNKDLKINIEYLEDSLKLKNCNNREFIRNRNKCLLNINSSQSFFFLRFICCEIAKNKKSKKWILIIDPDIFCLKPIDKINEYIIEAEKNNKSIICSNNTSSFMVINTEKIKWTEETIVTNIFDKKEDAENYMGLKKYKNEIYNIPEKYNSYDKLLNETICLHTSLTHTQPWKTGIKYFPSDLHNKIPQENEKKNMIFQKHKSDKIIDIVFKLFTEAYCQNFFTITELKDEIIRENIREDIFDLIKI